MKRILLMTEGCLGRIWRRRGKFLSFVAWVFEFEILEEANAL